MVPRSADVAHRLHGFYEDVGWVHYNDSKSEFDTIVRPPTNGVSPSIGYWQTENPGKITHFMQHNEDQPSSYSRGLWLPKMQELVEVCLVVPSDEDVHNIFEMGGHLMRQHSHIPPREHAGRQEFRFSDPFNYSLRVTADVGWETQRKKQQNSMLSILKRWLKF